MFLLGKSRDKTDRCSVPRATGQLTGPQDGRRIGCRDPPLTGREVEVARRPADPAGEELVELRREDFGTLEEEGPFLRGEGLECAQVQHGRICLDLAKVRVEHAVERKRGAQTVGEATANGYRILLIAETLTFLHQNIGHPFPVGIGRHAIQPDQPAKARDTAIDFRGVIHPEGALCPAIDHPFHIETPNLLRSLHQAKLAEGDRQFGAPPVLGTGRGTLPDRIPRTVESGIVEHDGIDLNPCRVDLKGITTAPIQVRVQIDHDLVRMEIRITPL